LQRDTASGFRENCPYRAAGSLPRQARG
jgi:hypothetical protein